MKLQSQKCGCRLLDELEPQDGICCLLSFQQNARHHIKGQCTYKVTLKRLYEITVDVEKQ